MISGLSGADAIDLSGFAYGANVTATYLGNASGGTLTVTDGAKTAKIALSGELSVVDLDALQRRQGRHDRGRSDTGRTSRSAAAALSGAWILPPTARWSGAPTPTAPICGTDRHGCNSSPRRACRRPSISAAQGVYEIQIAPSNSNIMYMMYDGYVFKSTNKGTTWTQTAFAQQAADNANDNYGQVGQKMAIDPNNPNIVYVGTETAGMFVTTNGGTTWSSVSAVPVGSGAGITGILFDPAVGGVVDGVTQTIFASSYGNGVYESTNGGTTWTALDRRPDRRRIRRRVEHRRLLRRRRRQFKPLELRQRKMDGIDSSNAQSGIQAVAVNPSNPNEIVVVTPGGGI